MKAIERVCAYLKEHNVPLTRFEKEHDMSNGYLGTMLKRKADLGETIILKIIDACPDMDLTWLLTGEEPDRDILQARQAVKNDLERQKAYEESIVETYEKALARKDEELKGLLREIALLKAQNKSGSKESE